MGLLTDYRGWGPEDPAADLLPATIRRDPPVALKNGQRSSRAAIEAQTPLRELSIGVRSFTIVRDFLGFFVGFEAVPMVSSAALFPTDCLG